MKIKLFSDGLPVAKGDGERRWECGVSNEKWYITEWTPARSCHTAQGTKLNLLCGP